jgi:hypothetical protein
LKSKIPANRCERREKVDKKTLTKKIAGRVMIGLILLAGAVPSQAIEVSQQTDANALAQALLAAGDACILITGATLENQALGIAASSGTFANVSGTYNNIGGTAGGVVISSGNVSDYSDGPDTVPNNSTDYGSSETPEQKALLDPITGPADHFDVTRLDITFDMQPGCNAVSVDGVFGSEEFPTFVGSEFVDGFGIYLNGTNIAFVGALPVNINHPAFADIRGTELNGVLAPDGNPVLTFSGSVGDASTGNKLTIIICDTNDGIYDSTAYVATLRGSLGSPASGGSKQPLRRSPRNSPARR